MSRALERSGWYPFLRCRGAHRVLALSSSEADFTRSSSIQVGELISASLHSRPDHQRHDAEEIVDLNAQNTKSGQLSLALWRPARPLSYSPVAALHRGAGAGLYE